MAWFVYPLLGWGVGLAFHYVEVFGIPGFDILSKEWEEKQLERELKQQDPTSKFPPNQASQSDKGLDLKELRKNYDESDFVRNELNICHAKITRYP